MPATSLFFGLAEQAINRYLSLDPEMSRQLDELAGRCICFEITAPEMRVYCLPRAGALSLGANREETPDCTVRGSALALFNMVRGDDAAQALSRGDVEILGESRIAQRFSDILKSIDIDWEELASKLVGDFTAHRLGIAFTQVKGWADETLAALKLDTREYLQEESDILPTRVEITAFLEQVDTFRTDVDRLEARIKRLERKQDSGL